MCNKHERSVRALLEGLAAEAGVTVTFDVGAKHRKYTVKTPGGERTKPFTVNPKNDKGQFGAIKREFNRVLRELGCKSN